MGNFISAKPIDFFISDKFLCLEPYYTIFKLYR